MLRAIYLSKEIFFLQYKRLSENNDTHKKCTWNISGTIRSSPNCQETFSVPDIIIIFLSYTTQFQFSISKLKQLDSLRMCKTLVLDIDSCSWILKLVKLWNVKVWGVNKTLFKWTISFSLFDQYIFDCFFKTLSITTFI